MKILAALLLSLSLPVARVGPPLRAPVDHSLTKHTRHRGSWYFAQTGHAVYCYGPVLLVPNNQGDLQRVATICRNGQTMVPLKD